MMDEKREEYYLRQQPSHATIHWQSQSPGEIPINLLEALKMRFIAGAMKARACDGFVRIRWTALCTHG